MPQVGPLEILVIFVVALLVFGPKEIPRLARQAAKGWREVQRLQASIRRDIDDVLRDADEEEDQQPGERGTRAPTLPPEQPDPPEAPEPAERPDRSRQAELDAGAAAPHRPSPPADPAP